MITRSSFLSTLSVLIAATSVLCAGQQQWDRAISLFNQKQYRPALREFHGVLRANPNYWQAWYYIGNAHFQLKEYEDTIDSFQNYLKGAAGHDKERATGNYFIGFSYYELKQYPKAIAALADYISVSEKIHEKVEATARAALGRAYIYTEQYPQAIAALTTAASEMKNNSNNYYYIGFAQEKLGAEDKAIAALNQALAIDPKDTDTLSLLGNIYLIQSRKNPAAAKQAVTIGERLLSVKNDEISQAFLGQAYLINQDYAKAAPLLDKVARAHPDSGGAWLNLGLALSRSNQWKPAAEALEQAVKITPASLPALLELGYVYESDKQYDKALQVYQNAYQASGNRDETAKAGIDRVQASVSNKPPRTD
jgi:tetratricopeptide (TPR) repeat protein